MVTSIVVYVTALLLYSEYTSSFVSHCLGVVKINLWYWGLC